MQRLTEKQSLFSKYMFTPGSESFGNGRESAEKAGYAGTDNYLARVASENVRKCMIMAEKERIQAVIDEKIDYNYDVAMQAMQQIIDWLKKKAESGDIQAIQATTAARREMNDISGLKKQRIIDETPAVKPLSDTDIAELKRLAGLAGSIKVVKDTA